jgi:hypothetical protein
MTKRLKTTGLAVLIMVLGMSIIVVVTEHEVGAVAAGPRLLTVADVVTAMNECGLIVAPERSPAHHQLLERSGTTIWTGQSVIEVYVYPDVATRVTDEQVIQRLVMRSQTFMADGDPPLLVTSARNVLLLFSTASAEHAASIHQAARSLTSVAGS